MRRAMLLLLLLLATGVAAARPGKARRSKGTTST